MQMNTSLFPQPNRGAHLIRCTDGKCVAEEDTPFNRHKTQEQLGVTEIEQVTARREIRWEQASEERVA